MTDPEAASDAVIVIVDDSEINRKILARLAAQVAPGATVRVYADPIEAAEAVESDPPDLVVTDYQMPGLNGAAFIERLRRNPATADLPVIVVTAYEDREHRTRALEAGASDYLLTPLDHAEFRARSRNLLALRRQQILLKRRALSLEEVVASEEARRRETLRATHDWLVAVVDAIPAGVSAVNGQGQFVLANERFAQSLGLSRDAVLGRTLEELVPGEQAERIMAIDRRLAEGSEPAPIAFEETHRPVGGEPTCYLTTKSVLHRGAPALPSRHNGEVTVVTVSIDIAGRKRAEAALEAAKEAAEEASRAKAEFLTNMSHELRTPLNAIIGFSQVMATEMLGPLGGERYVGYARDIADSAERLLAVISDILDVSRLETGKIELLEHEVDLVETISQVGEMLADAARERRVEVTLDASPTLPRLRADPRLLRQALAQVAGNAVKFSNPGGLVTIAATLDADSVVLTITDRGIGMDEEELRTAVARFGQVGSPWTRSTAGTGIGLPLAIGLIELHGGTVRIESRRDEGTIVSMVFPPGRTLAGARTGIGGTAS